VSRRLQQAIDALMVSVIESSRGTLLVTSIGFVKLVAVCHDPTRLAAVGPSPIAVAAESLAAFRGMARSSSQGEFQGSSRPSPKAGLDNGPPIMARLECL
jgi:hypothetical protein